VTLVSSNDTSGAKKNQDFTIPVLTDAVINFHWQYNTADEDEDALYDPFGYLLNDTFTKLTFEGKGSKSQQGDFSVAVFAGDEFGFRMNSDDSALGAATATVTNFSAVPLPAAVWLFGTGLFGFLWQTKRRHPVNA
jgi:hypothetical protein